MKFSLPQVTVNGLINRGPAVAAGDDSDGPGLVFRGGLFVPGPDFTEGVPGQLGSYVAGSGLDDEEEEAFEGYPAPRAPLSEVLQGPGRKEGRQGQPSQPWPLQAPGRSRPGAAFATRLVHDYQGAPGTFFRGLPFQARHVASYVGASNWLRAQSRDLDLKWTGFGWADGPRRERFQAGAEALTLMIGGGRNYPQRGVERASEFLGFPIEEMENIYRGCLHTGLLPRWDQELDDHPVQWAEIRSALLAMRIFTEEQVGLMAPWATNRAIRDSINRYASQGFVTRLAQDELALPVWRVTDQAVQDGLAGGLLTPREAEYRTSIRRGQLLHDLAVGDGIILVGMEVVREGITLLDLQTETALLAGAGKGSYPDFQVEIARGYRRVTVPVEVVGIGANYRAIAKQQKVTSSGFRVLSPGFDGMGVRFA